MAREYWFAFGPQPSVTSGLAPTFITFVNGSGLTQAPPTITETYVGTGLYKASYTPTQTIAFVLDGATTSLNTSARYIAGVFDPNDTIGQTLVGIGNTVSALGTQLDGIGNTASSFGDLTTSPGTLFGYSKRLVEFLEGNQTFVKASGALTFSSKGSSVLLASKVVSDSSTQTTKT